MHDSTEAMKEEGELSDGNDQIYTPLVRPVTQEISGSTPTAIGSNHNKMDHSDEDSDSDDSLKNINKVNKKLRSLEGESQRQPNPRHKYNIWSSTLQEDLMENLVQFDLSRKRDRNVEHYNFKRRKSNSTDYDSSNVGTSWGEEQRGRRPKKQKKVHRFRNFRHSDDSSNHSEESSARVISDLTVTSESSYEEVARDIAIKLYEEKDDLLLRVVEVLGSHIPIQIFKETQKIEREGGMMIINNRRRRTPGGVFLFLLKKSDEIRKEHLKQIFQEERSKDNKDKKDLQALNRNKKVEELKKSLNINGSELKMLPKKNATKLDLPESLSNPPPSPEIGSANRDIDDISPDPHKVSQKILDSQHIANESLPKESLQLISYEDDFIDMNCDVDMF